MVFVRFGLNASVIRLDSVFYPLSFANGIVLATMRVLVCVCVSIYVCVPVTILLSTDTPNKMSRIN